MIKLYKKLKQYHKQAVLNAEADSVEKMGTEYAHNKILFHKIKYLAQDGTRVIKPALGLFNGSEIRFANEHRKNWAGFEQTEAQHNFLIDLKKIPNLTELPAYSNQGGVIVFPAEKDDWPVQVDFDELNTIFKRLYYNILTAPCHNSGIAAWLKAWDNYWGYKHFACIGSYAVGNNYHGSWMDQYGNMYNNQSLCFEFQEMPAVLMMLLVQEIMVYFNIEAVLFKNYYYNRVYFVENRLIYEKEVEYVNLFATFKANR